MVVEHRQRIGPAGLRAELADLRKTFRFDEPPWQQYLHWMGFSWFVHFESADTGLLQGNLGRSMESNLPVNEILGDRLMLTFVISVLTILLTWMNIHDSRIVSTAWPK